MRYESLMPSDESGDWARICRVEAAWTSHLPTRQLLLALAAEFEAMAPATPAAATKRKASQNS